MIFAELLFDPKYRFSLRLIQCFEMPIKFALFREEAKSI